DLRSLVRRDAPHAAGLRPDRACDRPEDRARQLTECAPGYGAPARIADPFGSPLRRGAPMLPWESILTAYGIPVLSACLAEIAARIWIRWCGNYFVWTPHRRTHQVLDRPSLPTLPPLARFEVNGDGERGDPVPRRSEDCYRVVVLGASSTECRYLDQEDTW